MSARGDALCMPPVPPPIEELIGKLCDQIDRAEDKAARWGQELMAERKRANEAERARDAAIEALRPFAAMGIGIAEGWSDERRLATLSVEPLRVKDLRLAAALVALRDGTGGDPSPPVTSDEIPGTNPESIIK